MRRSYRAFQDWAARCYNIRLQAGKIETLRRLRVGQLRMWRLEQELLDTKGHAFICQVKGRRGGFTTKDQAVNVWLPWGLQGMDTLTLAATEPDMYKLFEITRRAINNFPGPRDGSAADLLGQLGDRETTEVTFPLRDSHYYTGTAGGATTGRGQGYKRVHCSEWPHYRGSVVEIINGFKPSMEGVPHPSIILEGTPSAYGSEAHQFWLDSVAGKNGFTAAFVPWWECDPLAYRLPLEGPDELGQLDEDEQLLVAKVGLDLEQIKWRRDRIAGPGGRAFFFNNYPEDPGVCWLTSGEGYYDVDRLKRLKLRAPAPNPALSDNEAGVMVYGEPPAGESLVLGADVAEGVEGDRSTFVIRSWPSWRLVATYASNRIEPIPFAALVDKWGRKWTPRRPAFLVVEKNMHGITVLRALRDAHRYPVERMYRRKPVDETRDEQTDKLGWATTGGQNGTQPLLLSAGFELFAAADAGQVQPPSAETTADAFSVVTGKNGKVSLTGRDILVAEMLAWVGRAEAARAASTWRVLKAPEGALAVVE